MRGLSSRLKWLLLIGVASGLMSLCYIDWFLRRPVGSGPAGPSVQREAFAQPWSTQKVHVLGIGDSITAGLGAKSPSHSYFQRLITNPEDEFAELRGLSLSVVLPNLSSENIAVSGSTSLQHVDYIRDRLKPHAEDVFGLVVMTTGGNDLIHNYGRSAPREGAMYGATIQEARAWIESFEIRLEGILDSIEELFPGGHEVYLANIYDPTDAVGDAPSIFLPEWKDGLAIHAEYNSALNRACQKRSNVHLVPLYETFLGHGAHCRQFWHRNYDSADPYYWFYSNVEDPNDRGYDAIRRTFLNSIIANSQLCVR